MSRFWPQSYSKVDLDRILAREEQKWAAYCRRVVLVVMLTAFALGFLAAWLVK